ncbi:hypothetical protein B0T22DRAFT_532495 [Podospora appendiculata]|uniref:BTB domain-containing protein n=1 Tax=Podospora appendiculata TaxID=314037 RepID=A0AAE1CG75_9PEZI|nr:hypothetical protein B0T22DRAFT_532495 [Podospora appendiculata]
MVNHQPASMTDDTTKPVILDADGDLFLVVEDTAKGRVGEFLVSSKILTLSSPIFCVMLGPNFEEGRRLRQGGRPRIHVKEDDLADMEIMLSIWHKNERDAEDRGVTPHSAGKIAAVAIQANKYACTAQFRAWKMYWKKDNDSWPDDSWTVLERGFLLLAEWLLRGPVPYFGLPKLTVQRLPYNFPSIWKTNQTIKMHLPVKLSYEDAQPCEMLCRRYSLGRALDENTVPEETWCRGCGQFCRDAPNTVEYDPQSSVGCCTRQEAVDEYLRILASAGLWLFSTVKYTNSPYSIFDIVDMLRGEKKRRLYECDCCEPRLAWEHDCDRGDDCFIARKLNVLVRKAGDSKALQLMLFGQMWRP